MVKFSTNTRPPPPLAYLGMLFIYANSVGHGNCALSVQTGIINNILVLTDYSKCSSLLTYLGLPLINGDTSTYHQNISRKTKTILYI